MDKLLLKYKIYQSAMRLFSSEGFENVTMGKIAKEVKLNEADVHLYFGSKEDIILHLY